MDKLINGIAAGGQLRVAAAITTRLVTEAHSRHKTSPTATAALGRALTGSLLLASTLKDFDRLTLRIDGDGPAGPIVAESTKDKSAAGSLFVRGYIKNPTAELPANSVGKFDVSGIVGKGTLSVIRESGFELGLRPEPYVGSVPITSGEIAEDLAYYLLNSEQIPSAVMLGVLLQNKDPWVSASGGVLIQAMPGADENMLADLESRISASPHLTSRIGSDTVPQSLLEPILEGLGLEILEEKQLFFRCSCSLEKAIALVAALGETEVSNILAEDKGASLQCGFCGENYQLTADHLISILNGNHEK